MSDGEDLLKPEQDEQIDRPCVQDAIRLGYESWMLHSCPIRIRLLPRLVDRFYDQFTPNAFLVLTRKMTKLENQEAVLCASPAYRDALEDYLVSDEYQTKDFRKYGSGLDIGARNWVQASEEFYRALSGAIGNSRRYSGWFSLGVALGQCEVAPPSADRRGKPGRQEFENLRACILALPQSFRLKYQWLEAFCNNNFAVGGPDEWVEAVEEIAVPAIFGPEEQAAAADDKAYPRLPAGERLSFWLQYQMESVSSFPEDFETGNAGEPDKAATPPEPKNGDGPRWDAKRHQFLFDGVVVHTYRRKAKNQFLVLDAFELDGWDTVIDTPLAKRHHSQTLKSLNKSAKGKIRFHADGTGEKLRWEKPSQKREQNRSI